MGGLAKVGIAVAAVVGLAMARDLGPFADDVDLPLPAADAFSDLFVYTCDDLADEAVSISADKAPLVELLKVRNPRQVENNQIDPPTPRGNREALLLKCRGRGVWSTGGDAAVVMELTVDSDGDRWVRYEPVGLGVLG